MRIFTLAVAFCLTLPLTAQTITKNIPYTPGQTADLYQPATPGIHPAIVYIHGGSWRSGSKSDYKHLAPALAAKGYTGFSINYSLDPKSFPTSWLQARAAITFLRDHAATYAIDPNRILIAGDSAGGELATLIALAPEGPASAKGLAIPVAAAIIFNGVFDLHSSAHVITRYLGLDCGAAQSPICDDASPSNHVHPNAPPFFIGHGTEDQTVAYAQAQLFSSQLHQAKIPVTFYAADKAPHSYWSNSHYYAANLVAVEDFLANLAVQ